MKKGQFAVRFVGFTVAMLCSLTVTTRAYALQFEFGGATLDVDTVLRYTLAQRVADQDSDLLADPNGDDGNRNFDNGSLIKNRFDAITDIDLNFGEVGPATNLGFFARGRAWYDFVYNSDNDNDSGITNNAAYNTPLAFGLYTYDGVNNNDFPDATEKWHGRKAEMLDYFLYSEFDFGGHFTTFRIGQQAVNWGETLFLVGGVMSSQGPIDATGFNQPGAELKELFLPVKQVAVQTDLTSNISMEAYYQWEWEPYRLDAAGSYFQTADVIDEGGTRYILAPGVAASRVANEDASDSGQWGVNLHYIAEGLAGTDFGLYYINYHDQLPMLAAGFADTDGDGIADTPTTYHLAYAEDIHLYAASFGAVIGDANISGEVAYRENVPVGVPHPQGLPLPAYERAEVVHYSLSGIYLFPPTMLTLGMTKMGLTAEAGLDQVLDMKKKELANDKTAWGYSFTLKPEWLAIYPKVDLAVPISLSQGVNGDSALGASFVEDKNKVGISFNFVYDLVHEVQIGYVNYFGSESDVKDRDYISVTLKYSF